MVPEVRRYRLISAISHRGSLILLGAICVFCCAAGTPVKQPGNAVLLSAIAKIKVQDFSSSEEILTSFCPGTMGDAIRGTQNERIPCMLILCVESEIQKLRPPDRTSLLYWTAADAAMRQGDPQVAKAIYEVAIDRYPPDPANWYWLGIVERDLGRVQESDAALRKSLALKPNDRDASYWLASNLIDEAKYEEADKILGSLLRSDDKDGASWLKRGEMLVRQRKCFEATALFEKAVGLGVDRKKVEEEMSECQGESGAEHPR